MGTLFTFIYDGIRTDFGYPARLMRLIQERPELAINVPEPAQNINASSVVRWDHFGQAALEDWPRRRPSQLRGWRTSGGYLSLIHI